VTDTIAEILQLALQHHQAGRWQEAEGLYQQVLQTRPDHPDALHLLGLIAHHAGRYEAAVELIGKAICVNPTAAVFHVSQGEAYHAVNRIGEAAACYERALSLQPDLAQAHSNLGAARHAQGKLEEAVAHCLRALGHQPDYAKAHYNLALVRQDQGKLEEAVTHYRKAVALDPVFAEAHSNLGNALKEQGRVDEAAACFRRALALKPDSAVIHSNLLLCLQYQFPQEPAALFTLHREWNDKYARPLAAKALPHSNSRVADRLLKIGYVSADFNRHPVGLFLKPVLARHDRTRFHVYCYSVGGKDDAVTAELRSHAGEWRTITSLRDEEVAALIRRDGIDILVDLSGHTARSRLLVFAGKPAPVQAAWIGYVDTTGLDTMDYLIVDECVAPTGGGQSFTERLVKLPGCYLCYEAPNYAPPVAPLPAWTWEQLTFGCFNNLAKINAEVEAIWARILLAVPESRLMLKTRALNDQQTRERLYRRFADLGVAPERIELQGGSLHPELLASYGQVDVALDPFPYTGGITTCEALWMGVPVITLQGATFLSRIGASLLARAGLSEAIASSPEHYVDLAVRLSRDLDHLSSLRSGLRARAAATLGNAAALTRHVEQAYRLMWRTWCGSGA
jgi:predicted O-linked N-acetylglucosamine transferase (SPINDLY family)